MSFSDVFKSDFVDSITSVSILDMVVTLALAFCIGAFIYWVYKKTSAGVMYSSSFGVTLIALTMVTALVILAVTSNVVLSLGMVGALSIVRFRTAIKEPLEIAFLFWSIAVGIVLAAGLVPLAVFGSLVIGIVLIAFVNRKAHYNPYIIVLRCNNKEAEKAAKEMIEKNTDKAVTKSKSVTKGLIELNIDVRLKNDDTDFVNGLSDLEGVESAVLVSYNGDYLS